MLEGDILDGRYKILRILGQGGMGKVYLAENIKLGNLWAVKEFVRKDGNEKNLLVEPNMLKKLKHPALPRVIDIIEDTECIYIIVDYIEGDSLDKRLSGEGRIPEKDAVEWARQICDVLIYLHELKPNPVIYRDMKPSNLILDSNGFIKLIDFGIAREYKAGADSDTIYIGTRGYAAPEQYGIGQTSVATDIYSLGVTIYHLLTGKSPNEPPYELKPVRTIDSSLSEGLEQIICKCTQLDPTKRYRSARELLNDLDNIKKLDRFGIVDSLDLDSYRTTGNKEIISFKRLIFAIPGNSEFACELAFSAARMTGLKVLLINFDFLSPKLDIYINLKHDSIKEDADNIETGFFALMNSIGGSRTDRGLFEKNCSRIDNIKNLYILSETFSIKNLDKFKDADIDRIIELAYRNYDITIIVVSRSIYDLHTINSMKRADFNLLASFANMDEVNEVAAFLKHMYENNGIQPEKTKYIAYEYKSGINLPFDILYEQFSKEDVSGYVSYDPDREKFRNINRCYASNIMKKHGSEDRNILAGFNIIPGRTFSEKVGEKVRQFKRRLIHKPPAVNWKSK